jgi:hypothetical protein
MSGERLILPTRSRSGYRCWERRNRYQAECSNRAFDPVKENTRRLFPNDPHEAQPPVSHWGLVTSHRSLVRPFTPIGFRLSPTRGV